FGRSSRGTASRAARAQRGYDLETQVELTLQEVATRAEKSIELERQDACENCRGSGAKAGTSPTVCPQCGGQGRVAQQGFGGMFRIVTTCPNCRGRGTIVRDHCPACGGTGRQLRKRVVTVRIPAGVHEGQAVRIAGEGEPGANGAATGDLHCYIVVKPHPIFSRHNNDLVCQFPITFAQAALGARVQLHTLKRPEERDIPSGTQHGEVFKLKGKGLPDVRSHRMGDELVQVLVEIPKKLNEKQKQLLKEFATTEDGNSLPQRKGFLDKLKDVFKVDD